MSVLGHDDVGDLYNWGRIIAIWSEKFEMRKLNAFVGRLCQQQKMLETKKTFLTNSDKMSVIVKKISLKLQIQRWRKKRIFVLRKTKINMNAGS